MTQLQPARCKQAEYVRSIFAVDPEAGTPFEALLTPHYWAHVSMNFRPGTLIQVFPPEGHYFAELLVRDCGRLWAKVATVRHVEFEAAEAAGDNPDYSNYTVTFCGPNARWCVHRKVANGKKDLLKSEFGDRDVAEAWLRQHVKTVARPVAA